MKAAKPPPTPGEPVRFTFNGQEYAARSGETLAAALLRSGVLTLAGKSGETSARGAFCWMGWCQECRVLCGGRLVEACRLVVHDGMEAEARRTTDAT